MSKNFPDKEKLDEALLEICVNLKHSAPISEKKKWAITELIEIGANVNPNTESWPPLMFAVTWENLSLAKLLLENKADPNYTETNRPNIGGNLPILRAIALKNCEMFKLLIDYGADKKLLKPNNGNRAFEMLEHYTGDEIYEVFHEYKPIKEVQHLGDSIDKTILY